MLKYFLFSLFYSITYTLFDTTGEIKVPFIHHFGLVMTKFTAAFVRNVVN